MLIVGLTKAEILLYGMLKAYGKSVQLALEINDEELAREYANKSTNKKVQQELWMDIATHLFKMNSISSSG